MIIQKSKNMIEGQNPIIVLPRNTRQYSQPTYVGKKRGFLMLLNANTHMLHNKEGINYFEYPTSDNESLPEYLSNSQGVQNCQRAMEIHTLSHIDNRSSYGHGLIVQAPLDIMLVCSQTNNKNIERMLQIVAGKLAVIAHKDIQKMENDKTIPQENFHDGFKLNFTIYFILLLAEIKSVDERSHAYKRIKEAFKVINERSIMRNKYGEDLTTVANTTELVVSKWDSVLLRNYGIFDRQILEDQLPLILNLFQKSIEMMRVNFQNIIFGN